MRFLILALLSLTASESFGGEKNVRYVFYLLDSGFTAKARIESNIKSSADPDTSEVLNASRSISFWTDFKLNSKAIYEVWLTYKPPADPGEIIFVSNTTPTYPLLRLKIDAMCGGCFSQYDTFGNVTTPPNVSVKKNNLMVTELKNDFNLGSKLSDSEKVAISNKINDYAFEGKNSLIQVNVLKLNTMMKSTDGIVYVAYYSTSSILPQNSVLVVGKRQGPKDPDLIRDVLGRVKTKRSNFNFTWVDWRVK